MEKESTTNSQPAWRLLAHTQPLLLLRMGPAAPSQPDNPAYTGASLWPVSLGSHSYSLSEGSAGLALFWQWLPAQRLNPWNCTSVPWPLPSRLHSSLHHSVSDST